MLKPTLHALMVCALSLLTAAHAADARLLIHGGAGIERAATDPKREAAIRAALAQALRAGQQHLGAHGSALDAVSAAVVVLEDSPLFNAGRGAVFTHDGVNELDASIMDGATRAAGAVAGVTTIRNPILLARAVMERSPHVMLARDGAEAFAHEIGIARVPPSYFHTDHRWQQLQRRLDADRPRAAPDADQYRGTVGAVAVDAQGRLAAATSTGGMTDKRWGRIGDSPVIGAGTYADAGCAVSGTGWGEFYLRSVAAYEICRRIADGVPVAQAARGVINVDIPALGGDGGAIVIGADGRIATPFNTGGMPRGWIGAEGEPQLAVFEADTPSLDDLHDAADGG